MDAHEVKTNMTLRPPGIPFLKQKLMSWIEGSKSKTVDALNCWFCNTDFNVNVQKNERIGWTCPSCQQYNGFKEDGDYDCLIEEQHDNSKATKKFCQQGDFNVSETILCRSCIQNEVLKVGQLASFVPLLESTYEDEVDAYRNYLESVYQLCHHCKDKVNVYLDKQNDDIIRKLAQENLTIKEGGFVDDVSQNIRSISKRIPDKPWIKTSLFWLCLLMSLMNMLCSVRLCLESRYRRMNEFLPQSVYLYIHYGIKAFSPLPVIQRAVQLTVYFGAGVCVLGYLLIEKACIYLVDTLHILLWLFLLICNALTFYSVQHILAILDVSNPVYLFLSIATTSMCLMCLMTSRLPRNVSRSNLHKKAPMDVQQQDFKEKSLAPENGMPESPSSINPVSSFSSSPSPYASHVGEARNFFKPISTSPRSSPSSFSSTSPDVVVAQDQSNSKSALNLFKPMSTSQRSSPLSFLSTSPDVAVAQEQSNTGPKEQSNSKSAFEMIRDGLETFSFGLTRKSGSSSSIWSFPSIVTSDPLASPDSIVPDSIVPTNQQENLRNILSPSRLSFLSFSSSPSPGNFSSSPSPELDSGCIHDSSQHLHLKCKDRPVIESSSFSDLNLSSHSAKDMRPHSHSSPFHNVQQNQSFTKYRSGFNNSAVKSGKVQTELFPSSRGEKVVAVPDSTSIENAKNDLQTGPRRSNRIAMRGKIIKPWPLKKSLSVNDMYDKSNNVEIIMKQKCTEQSLYGEKLSYDGVRKRQSIKKMERIAEFSDDEDMDDSHWRGSNRRIMRGETVKATESKWAWTLFGLIIGISVTVNFFLGLNLWMKSNTS